MRRTDTRIGIMLAPGARDDDSVNAHITDVAQKIRKRIEVEGTRPSIDIVHPELSAASIENASFELLNHRCTHIFVVGEQCRPTIEEMRKQTPALSALNIFFLNDGRIEPITSNYCEVIDVCSGSSAPSGANMYAHNYFEPHLTEALAQIIVNFSRELSKSHSIELKPVLIAAAPVPVVRRWQLGFDRFAKAASSSFSLDVFHLGTGYGRFNDPWSAYELTRYLTASYGANLILEVAGASSRGIVAALREGISSNPVYYCPFDQKPKMDFVLPAANIPFCVERNIEEYFLTALNNNDCPPDDCGRIYCRDVEGISAQDYMAEIDLSESQASISRWE